MAARGRSNPLALAVLTSLAERSMHPYEIAQTLKQRAKDETIRLNYGSLYSVVDSLAKRGLIEVADTFRDGRRPERTVYAITDAGRREMTDWLTDLVALPVKEYLQFEAGLTMLAALPPDEALAALRLRLQRLEAQVVQARALLATSEAAGLPRLFSIEAEYVQALLEAETAFVRELVDDIEHRRLSGIEAWQRWAETGEVPEFTWPSPSPALEEEP